MISWPNALTLLERFALLRSEKQSLEKSPSEMDMARAQQRFARWQKEKVFAEQEVLVAERLTADGISESEFLSLLGTPATAFAKNTALPEWALRIIKGCNGAPL